MYQQKHQIQNKATREAEDARRFARADNRSRINALALENEILDADANRDNPNQPWYHSCWNVTLVILGIFFAFGARSSINTRLDMHERNVTGWSRRTATMTRLSGACPSRF